MDNYYLQINFINRNNKKVIVNYQLYNKNNIIKQYDEVKEINKIIREYKKNNKLEMIKNDTNYIIDDIEFIKKYIGIPSKKVTHKNKYIKELAFISALAISAISVSVADHNINPNLYNNSNIESNKDDIDDEIDFVFIDNKEKKEITTEDPKKEIDATLIQSNDYNNNETFKIVYYSDNDDNIQESKLPTEIVSSSNNFYTFTYEYEDRSDNEYLDLINNTYANCIKRCSEKYGIDPNLITAMICQENKEASVNNSNIGGVGLLQVERQIWNGFTMNDIDGTSITINCDEINNISSDYERMNQVSMYLNDLNNGIINENDYINYNITEDDINKYHNAEKSIEIGCMISENYQNQIIKNNENNLYKYKLTLEECELLGIWAHNKGINQIENCLKNTNSFEETINYIRQTPYGDNEYLEHIISFLPNNTNINMKTRDNNVVAIKFVNNNDVYSRSI